jgi:hypothetical protein
VIGSRDALLSKGIPARKQALCASRRADRSSCPNNDGRLILEKATPDSDRDQERAKLAAQGL